MMSHLKHITIQLWRDTRASSQIEGYIMLATAIGIGCIVGVATLRGYILQEFGNAAEVLESIDQSYSINIRNPVGEPIYTASYQDPGPLRPNAGTSLPACMEFAAPVAERQGQ